MRGVAGEYIFVPKWLSKITRLMGTQNRKATCERGRIRRAPDRDGRVGLILPILPTSWTFVAKTKKLEDSIVIMPTTRQASTKQDPAFDTCLQKKINIRTQSKGDEHRAFKNHKNS